MDSHILRQVRTSNLDLDQLSSSVFTFDVVATDAGNPPRSSSVPVTVTIDDVNEKSPVFVEDSIAPLSVVEGDAGVNEGSLSY